MLAARPKNLATITSKGTFSLAIFDRPRVRSKQGSYASWPRAGGTQCGCRFRQSLPELSEFYKQHAADRNRFEILAICDTSSDEGRSIEEFEVLSAGIVKNEWGGKQLPFPVLLDGKGRTSQCSSRRDQE